MLNRLPLILIALVGCRYSDKSMGMSGGGTPTDLPTGGDSDGDDTGGGGGGGSAPVISDASGSWDLDAEPPRALIDIVVTDADGDLHNGKAGVSLDGSAETWFIIQDEDSATGQIEAIYDPETETVSLTAEVDYIEGEDLALTVRVKDAQDNISESYSFSPE